MLGWEQLHVLGYPVWGPGARAAGVDPCHSLGNESMHEQKIVGKPIHPCFVSISCSNKTNSLAKDVVDTSYISECSLRTISGNGMSLACAGFTLLMAVLCTDDRAQAPVGQ